MSFRNQLPPFPSQPVMNPGFPGTGFVLPLLGDVAEGWGDGIGGRMELCVRALSNPLKTLRNHL